MAELTVLNEHFAIPNHLHFDEGPGGLPTAEITSPHASARILLQGAQVIDWTPDGQQPVIWVSEKAQYAPAKAVRGGIPICWPWFGPHPTKENYPAHGIARSAPWEVIHTELLGNGSVRLGLQLVQNELTEDYWPQPSDLFMTVDIGKELHIELLTRNNSPIPMEVSEALHTYFQVSNINQITIEGLNGVDYVDKVDNLARKAQQGNLTVSQETDLVFVNTTGLCQINDPAMNRRILIEKEGSDSTVVWNPWQEKSHSMSDMADDSYLTMVCVETANALENKIIIEPEAEHRLFTKYRVDTFN